MSISKLIQKTGKYRLYLFLLIAFTLIIRILISINFGLGDDEAHYWQYSQNISLSYYDHPPLVAYLIGLSTRILGNTELGVRMVAIVCFMIASLLLFFLAENMYGSKIAFYSTMIFQVIPVFFMGSIITIPDAPLSVLWLGFLYVFYRCIIKNELSHFYLIGTIIGLGLLSKYTAVFMPVSAIIFLLFSKKHRHMLFDKRLYLSFIVALIIFMPVILWNWEFNFVSFNYQMSRGLTDASILSRINPMLFLRNVAGQAAYISPVLFIVFLYVVFFISSGFFTKKYSDTNRLFLLSFSLPILLVFNLVGLFKEILPHWMVLGFIPLIIATVYETENIKNTVAVTMLKYFSLAVSLIITLTIILHALFKIVPLPKNTPESMDVTNELYGWKTVGEKINTILKNENYFILTNKHYLASQLAFYVPLHPKIYCLNSYIDQYDFWQENINEIDGKDALFVTDNRFYVKPGDLYRFNKISQPEIINIYRNNKTIRTFYLFRCKSFQFAKTDKNMAAPVRKNILSNIKYYDESFFFIINILPKRSSFVDDVMILLTEIGYGVFTLLVVGIILFAFDRKNMLNDLLTFFIILLIGGIFIQILKSFYDQPRPFKEFTNIKILLSPLKEKGFPSGHTYTAFAAAACLYEKFKNILYNKFWLYCSFLIAALVGFSRIYVGAHFLTDVIAGAFIGIFFTFSAFSVLELFKTHKIIQNS